MTDEQLRCHLEMPEFRITWARHRLIYLQHIAKHAADFHCQLLLLEYAQGRGWRRGVSVDPHWLYEITDIPFAIPEQSHDLTAVWDSLRDCTFWKGLVKRACRKHILQIRIAYDVKHYHSLIVQEIT